MEPLLSNQINFTGKTGIACLGAPGEVVGNVILPKGFSTNVGLYVNPKLLLNDETVGQVRNHRIQDGKLVFLLKLNNIELRGVYWCEFGISKLFSVKVGQYHILEEVIVEYVRINEPINISN